MAYEPELERLERRYQDDPARNFAQLAEAYRKAGRLDDALTLLRGHLAERPNYVSGLVVLGRCLLDQHDDGEARETFERVLAVDAEHIIALRALGDIAERGGAVSQARTWFGRLLDIDPMNDEAEAAMQRLANAVEAPAAPPEPAAPAEPAEPGIAEVLQAEIDAEAAQPGYPEPAEVDLVQLPDPAAFESALEPVEDEQVNEYQVEEATEAFMPRATYAQPVDVEQIGHIDIASSLPEEEPLIGGSARYDVPEEYSLPMGEPEVEFGFGEPEETGMEGLEPTAADLSHVEPVAEDLGAVPFDDALGWGAGERISRQISQEDLEEAEQAHDAGLEAAAVSELPGLETTELPTGDEGPPPPVEGLEAGETLAEVVPLAGLEPVEAAAGAAEAAEAPEETPEETPDEESLVEFVSMPEPEPEDAFEVVSEEVVPVVPETPVESEEAAFDATGEVVDRATAERRASLFGLPLIEELPPEAPLVLDAQPEPVVTETMAELYVRQGLMAEARDVYEQMLRERPGDARLQARLAELSRPAARAGAYAASETGGPSVRALLLEVLASRPGAPAPIATPSVVPVVTPPPVPPAPMEQAFGGESDDDEALGAPTRPASDEVSLAAIFGDPGAPPPPPVAAEIAREPAPKSARAAGGFSFDEFFGKPSAGEAKPDDRSRRDTLADDEGEEAFKDWLRGLKS